MVISANNVNYATPSYDSIIEEGFADYAKYFSLHDNVLNGTFCLLGNETPLWSNSLSNASGVLVEPVEINVINDGAEPIHALKLRGDATANVYPTSFTFTLYNSTTTLFQQTFTNSQLEWLYPLPVAYNVTHYTITINEINRPNYTLRITNAYNNHFIKRNVNQDVSFVAGVALSQEIKLFSNDQVMVNISEVCEVINTVSSTDVNSIVINENIKSIDVKALSIDTCTVNAPENEITSVKVKAVSVDNYTFNVSEASQPRNTIRSTDITNISIPLTSSKVNNTLTKKTVSAGIRLYDESKMHNIHTVMSRSSRQIHGKLIVTYMNPLVDTLLVLDDTGTAYNASVNDVINANIDIPTKQLRLYSNGLDGSFKLIGINEEKGWWSDRLSDSNGEFAVPVKVAINFSARLVSGLNIISSATNNLILVNYNVRFTSNGLEEVISVVDNNLYNKALSVVYAEVTKVEIEILKINKPNAPANITEVSVASTLTYESGNLMSIDLLEELSYNDDIESLGGISANELTAMIDNTDKMFYFNNPVSLVAKQLKKNRKLEGFLGAEVVPGEIEWHKLGTFWSHNWDVPVGGLYAKVTAFDTIGLLNTFTFRDTQVYTNHSIGQLITVVLINAKLTYTLLEWQIDPTLFDVVIPYAWFALGSHMAALEKIAKGSRINIYCDRDGRVVATPRRIDAVSQHGTWSDSTNVISKTYPTLYTSTPNRVDVYVTEIALGIDPVISYSIPIDIGIFKTLSLTASSPIVGDIEIVMDKDVTVDYTYEYYSWGVDIEFTGTGTVRSIAINANCITSNQASFITVKDDSRILADGLILTTIKSDFVQTSSYAKELADIIFEDSTLDIYDSDVEYRGDMAIAINNTIKLDNGIATTDKYTVKRHELFWNGALTGKAKLNT